MIAYDNSCNGEASVATYTQSLTVGSGDSRLLVVGITSAGNTGANYDVITGVTYNGVAMTLVDKQLADAAHYTYLYYLLNPASGANNIVVSNGASTGPYVIICAASYTGVKQTAQPDATNKNIGHSVNTLSTPLTTVANNCWGIMYHNNDGTAGVTAGTNAYKRVDQSGRLLFDSNAALTPAGSFPMSTSLDASPGTISQIIASFSPVPSVSGGMLMFF